MLGILLKSYLKTTGQIYTHLLNATSIMLSSMTVVENGHLMNGPRYVGQQ